MKLENIDTAKKLIKKRDELSNAGSELKSVMSARLAVIIGSEEYVIPYDFKHRFIGLISDIQDEVEAELEKL